jgi:CcmD family protein
MRYTCRSMNNVTRSRVCRATARLTLVLAFAGVLACSAPAAQSAQPPSPQQQSEFIPIDQLPPEERLAAAPLLIGAYVFVIAVLFVYLVSLARRLGVVQREVERLEADLKRSGRA